MENVNGGRTDQKAEGEKSVEEWRRNEARAPILLARSGSSSRMVEVDSIAWF